MKRTALIGAACFLLGSMSSPRAAGTKHEALDIACARFKAANGERQIKSAREAWQALRGPKASAADRSTFDASMTKESVLLIVRAVACGDAE
jgi:hypothetical protein